MKWMHVFLLVAFTMSATHAAHATDTKERLSVGMELSYPPFEMMGKNGTPTGVSVDLAHALGKFLDRPVVIQNTAFDGLIPALKTGKIDLIISSMTATPQRAKSIAFSDPYLKTGLCLLVRKETTGTSIADFNGPGQVIAVKKGTTGHIYTAQHAMKAKVLVLDKESSGVLEVVQGKADAFIYDQMSTYQNWKRNQDTTRPLLKPFQEESWAIGIRKGNESLRKQVNAFLADFQANGGFTQLSETYLKEQKDAFQKLDIPFFF